MTGPQHHAAYIGLGSNLGDRRAAISAAAAALRSSPGVLDLRLSSLHETAPADGPAGQGMYLNAAARLATALDVYHLLEVMQRIEHDLGRIRAQRWGPRTIDLDLLLFDDLVLDTPRLSVPHPRLPQRRFVLAPLAEIAGEVLHPVIKRTVAELLQDLPQESPADAHPREEF